MNFLNSFKNLFSGSLVIDEDNYKSSKFIHYSNQDKYVGDIKSGKKEGQGTYTQANGDRYEGEWKNNKRNGFGKMYYNNQELYIGQWVDNVKQGNGK